MLEGAGLSITRKRGNWHNEAVAMRAAMKADKSVRDVRTPTLQEIYLAAGANYGGGSNAGAFVRAFPSDKHMKGLGLAACRATFPVLKWYEAECEGNKKMAFKQFHEEFISELAAGWILGTDISREWFPREPLRPRWFPGELLRYPRSWRISVHGVLCFSRQARCFSAMSMAA